MLNQFLSSLTQFPHRFREDDFPGNEVSHPRYVSQEKDPVDLEVPIIDAEKHINQLSKLLCRAGNSKQYARVRDNIALRVTKSTQNKGCRCITSMILPPYPLPE